MNAYRNTLLAAGAALALMVLPVATASAQCVNKGGEGTNSTLDGARFQAWEAVLQATDWGMWANWMASSQKVATAPGYKVSKVRWKCGAGGLGSTCRVFATLCK